MRRIHFDQTAIKSAKNTKVLVSDGKINYSPLLLIYIQSYKDYQEPAKDVIFLTITTENKSQTFQNPAAVGSTGLSPGGKKNKKYLQQSPSSSSKTYNHGVYSPGQQTPVSIIKNQEAQENRDQNKVLALFKSIVQASSSALEAVLMMRICLACSRRPVNTALPRWVSIVHPLAEHAHQATELFGSRQRNIWIPSIFIRCNKISIASKSCGLLPDRAPRLQLEIQKIFVQYQRCPFIFKRILFIFRGRRDSDEDDDLSQFWPILIEKAMKEWRDQVDEQEINQMLKNFDPDDNGWRPQ